ncbi:hypothetical protein N9N67_03900 [Bacteriovoracaceae bacterium]|nr:hypothetical protein [Bacteriovoracaceae bacterium]
MKLLILLFILSFQFSVKANNNEPFNHPWKALQGCYKTLEWNGEKVKDAPENLSVFEQEDDWVLTDLKEKSIDSLVMFIFQGCEDDECLYDYSSAFTKLGKYVKGRNGTNKYQYQGELIYMEDLKVKINMSISYKKLSGNRIQLTSKREVKSTDGELDADEAYVLKSVKCPDHIQLLFENSNSQFKYNTPR